MWLFLLQKIIVKQNIYVSIRLPCLKGIPLLGEMSRSDKRVAVPARKGDRVSGGGILIVPFNIFKSLSHGKPCQLSCKKGAKRSEGDEV